MGTPIKITVNGIDVQVVRKDIKNLHLAVYPPEGHVRVAVPDHVTDDNIRLAVISKLGWIKKQQRDFKEQPRQSERRYISGECHYVFGTGYRLALIEREGKPAVKQLKSGKLQLFVKPESTVETKEKVLNDWYRKELKKAIPELLEKWQPVIGVDVQNWGIRKMKTKWGSCNIERRRIWLNLELAKKPPECLEYILVHELLHLHERHHNERFKGLLDQYLPQWQSALKLLNGLPLAYEEWSIGG